MLAAAAGRPFAAREGVKRKSMQFRGAASCLEMLAKLDGPTVEPVPIRRAHVLRVKVPFLVEEVRELLGDFEV